MKNKVLVLSAAIVFVFSISFLTSCNSGGEQGGTETSVMAANYVCPMHPEETSNEEGSKCGVCGMDLVLAESLEAEAEAEAETEIVEAEGEATDSVMEEAVLEEVEAVDGEDDDSDVDEHEGHNH